MTFTFLALTSSASLAAPKTSSKGKGTVLRHKVAEKETLYSISRKYGVTVDELKKANGLKDNQIRAGAIIKIPSKSAQNSASATKKTNKAEAFKTTKKQEVKKTKPKEPVFGTDIVKEKNCTFSNKAEKKDFSAPSAQYQKPCVHYWKRGDSFAKLEKLYGLRKGELKAFNSNLNENEIHLKRKLQIPENVNIRNVRSLKDAAKAVGVSVEYISHLEDIEKKYRKLDDDGAGNQTVGIGHHAFNGFEKKYYSKRKLNDADIYRLLARDLTIADNTLKKTLGENAYAKLSSHQREALIDYIFNRGAETFRSSDCAPLVSSLKAGKYARAAHQFYTPNSFKNDSIKLGISKRRLYELKRFTGGKMNGNTLAAAQKLYDAGASSSQAGRRSTLAGFNKEVNRLFNGKIKLKKINPEFFAER